MKIEAIEKGSLTDQVQDRILGLIRENGLRLGDCLPTELELAERLQVGRSVIREALSRLRMLGILDSRKKRGLIVGEPDIFGGCQHILDAAFLSKDAQQHLTEMRLILEMGLAELLFLRKSPEHIQNLRHIVAQQEQAKSDRQRIRLEIAFHAALYQIVGNSIMSRFQALLQPFFEEAVAAENGVRSQGQATHADLVDQLESGTPESFRQAMRQHLLPHFERLQ